MQRRRGHPPVSLLQTVLRFAGEGWAGELCVGAVHFSSVQSSSGQDLTTVFFRSGSVLSSLEIRYEGVEQQTHPINRANHLPKKQTPHRQNHPTRQTTNMGDSTLAIGIVLLLLYTLALTTTLRLLVYGRQIWRVGVPFLLAVVFELRKYIPTLFPCFGFCCVVSSASLTSLFPSVGPAPPLSA